MSKSPNPRLHYARKPASYPADHPGFPACVGSGQMRLQTSNRVTTDILRVNCKRCLKMHNNEWVAAAAELRANCRKI